MTIEEMVQIVSASGSYPVHALALCPVCMLREEHGGCRRYGSQHPGCMAGEIPLIDLCAPSAGERVRQALDSTVQASNRLRAHPDWAAA